MKNWMPTPKRGRPRIAKAAKPVLLKVVRGDCTRVLHYDFGEAGVLEAYVMAEELDDLELNFVIDSSQDIHGPWIFFDPDLEKKRLIDYKFETHMLAPTTVEEMTKDFLRYIQALRPADRRAETYLLIAEFINKKEEAQASTDND